jgi:hypothetical protein
MKFATRRDWVFSILTILIYIVVLGIVPWILFRILDQYLH